MNHIKKYRLLKVLLTACSTLISSSFKAKAPCAWETIQHSITTILNSTDPKKSSKVYLTLTETLQRTRFNSDNPYLRDLLTTPLKYTTFERSVLYDKALSRAKKQYAKELLKHIPELGLCPSEALLFNANKAMADGFKKLKNKHHHHFTDACDRMIAKEKEIYKKGNIALYHGTTRYNFALAYLHTKLHEIFYGPTPGYLQFRQPLQGVTQELTDESTRKQYLKRGGVWLKFNNAQHLLFCNCGLTANLNQRNLFKEDSLTFFTAEKSLFAGWKRFLNFFKSIFFGHKPKLSARRLFEHYNMSDIYRTYRHRIKKLMRFKAHGNIMLQIELTPALAEHVLFPAAPIGKKEQLIVNTQKTSDPLKILHTLCANPSAVIGADKTIWCLILTDDLLLNPYHPIVHGNVHVHPYSMSQKKLEKIIKKIDILVKEIREKIK